MKKITVLFTTALLFCGAGVMNAAWTYGTNYSESDYNNSATTTTKEGDTSWNNGSGTEQGVRLGGSSTSIIGKPAYNWDDKYVIIVLEGNVPGTLSFSYRTNSSSATSADWYVAESSDGTNWTNIWSTTRSSSSSADATADISKGTHYLKLCYSGNFSGYYFHPLITPSRSIGDPSVTALDFGQAKVSTSTTKTFTVDWCAVPALTYSVSGANADDIAVSIANNAQETTYGTATVSVEYKRAIAGSLDATLTIQGYNNYSKTISLTGNAENYYISWLDEDSTLIATDSLAYGVMPEKTLTKEATAQYSYSFNGWTPELVAVSADASYQSLGFTATAIPYAITYADSLNAQNPNPTSYTCETETIVLDALTMEGYTFLGWFDAGNNPVTEIAKGTTGNISLTAGWEIVLPEPTALVETHEAKATKLLLGGQIYILRDAHLYDLCGHKVK